MYCIVLYCKTLIQGDGEIQIEELVDNLDVLIKYSVDGSKLEDAFKQLDRNGDGFISWACFFFFLHFFTLSYIYIFKNT